MRKKVDGRGGGWRDGRAHARGVGREGILWGMPGESLETNGAAQCACVELISSPSSPSIRHPLPPTLHVPPVHPFATLSRSRSAGSARGEHGVPWDLAPLPLRTFHPSTTTPLSTIPSPAASSFFNLYFNVIPRSSSSRLRFSSVSLSLSLFFSLFRYIVFFFSFRCIIPVFVFRFCTPFVRAWVEVFGGTLAWARSFAGGAFNVALWIFEIFRKLSLWRWEDACFRC